MKVNRRFAALVRCSVGPVSLMATCWCARGNVIVTTSSSSAQLESYATIYNPDTEASYQQQYQEPDVHFGPGFTSYSQDCPETASGGNAYWSASINTDAGVNLTFNSDATSATVACQGQTGFSWSGGSPTNDNYYSVAANADCYADGALSLYLDSPYAFTYESDSSTNASPETTARSFSVPAGGSNTTYFGATLGFGPSGVITGVATAGSIYIDQELKTADGQADSTKLGSPYTGSASFSYHLTLVALNEPGSTQGTAIAPISGSAFSGVPSNRWVTSPSNAKVTYQTTDGTLFTNILAFGSSGGPYDVNVGGVDLGDFSSTSYLNFSDPQYASLLGNLLIGGNGVRSFTVTDLSGGSNAFAAQLAFSSATSSFAANPIVPAVKVSARERFQFTANPGVGIALLNASGLTLGPGAMAAMPVASGRSSRQLLILNALNLSGSMGHWTGLLDLANNDMDLPGASLATITNQLREGYVNGNWDSTGGISSSAAAADTSHLTALGVIQNDQGGSPLFSPSNLFDGYVPGANDVLVKYTYYGDTTLKGYVDGSDYSRIDNAYLSDQTEPGEYTGWFNGDFNYDGVIDGSDYTLIDNAFNTQGAALTATIAGPSAVATTQFSGTIIAVPEPASVSLLALGVFRLLGRRRRWSGAIQHVHPEE